MRLYCGSNGPLGMAVGGATMDGLIFGGHYMAARRNRHIPQVAPMPAAARATVRIQ